jgi:hypothetical protein
MRQTIAASRDQAPAGSCKTFAVESSYVATGLVHSRRARLFCKDCPKPVVRLPRLGFKRSFDKATAGPHGYGGGHSIGVISCAY